MEKPKGWRWWAWGMLRESVYHLVIAALIWAALRWALGSREVASVGAAMFFAGREVRDFEIEALPGIMQAIGFEGWNGLRPAMKMDLAQLRHSLSGWVPVTVGCLVAYWFGP